MINRMAEIAKMFGVKLGEPFKIEDGRKNFLNWERYYRFTNNGMERSKDEIRWEKCMSEVLEHLLIGAIGIKQPWKPQEGEAYFIPCINYVESRMSLKFDWHGSDADYKRYRLKIVCRTQEEAVELTKKMMLVAINEQ